MATTTTNFGWDIPQSTDLVKDGATAIAALGQDIDTAFVDFKGGTTGQVLKKTSNTDLDVEWGTASSGLTLINTTSFSAVASTSLAADTFTSTYDNYRIVISGTSSATGYIAIRFRTAGSDNTTSNYYHAMVQTRTGATQTLTGGGGVNISTAIRGSATGGWRAAFDIINPKSATDSKSWIGYSTATDATGTHIANTFGTFLGSTSFDSLSFIAETGTITGSYSVYGYSK